MSTDKLADALAPLYDDSDAYDNRYAVTTWLRSPDGIKLLSDDETIREGIKGRLIDPDYLTVCLTHRRHLPCRRGARDKHPYEWCYDTQDEDAVKIVKAYQSGLWDD